MKMVKSAVVALTLASLLGCSAMEEKAESANAEAAKAEMEMSKMAHLYEVHKDGRIYVFYDKALYSDFLKTGHTAYMFSRIGSGPNGETMVFALTGKDKKKRTGIPSVELVDGSRSANVFYGETYDEGRLYVFGAYELMESYRKTGEATFRFTDIGAGPKGETVVYVLSKKESKKRPDALMAMFKKICNKACFTEFVALSQAKV